MAIDKLTVPNIDAGDLVNFPNGRIKDNTGPGDGTPVNRMVYGDIHEFFAAVMRLGGVIYNNLPDSVGTGYQLVDAMRQLAGKNDLLQTLNSDGTTVVAPVKIGLLLQKELLLYKSGFDYAAEAQIIGNESTPVIKTLTVPSAFKTNDLVLLEVTSGGVTLHRVVNAENLSAVAAELGFLKAASNLEAIAGSLATKAVTPASLIAAFAKWVTDPTGAAPYLATDSDPGIMSAADKAKLDALTATRNVGWFSGLDIGAGTISSNFATGGDITLATLTSVGGTGGGESVVRITMANAMDDTNYFARIHLESQVSMIYDNDSACPVFKPFSATQFDFTISEIHMTTQTLKVHLEVVQLS